MTKSKTTPLERIGLLHIDPILDPKTGEIQLYDMYFPKDIWHGSRGTRSQVELYNNYLLGLAREVLRGDR